MARAVSSSTTTRKTAKGIHTTTSASGVSGRGSTVVAESEAWRKDAVCASVDPEIWFPERGSNGADAKMICATCPVRVECLHDAISNGMTDGIWGGMNPAERRAVSSGRASSELAPRLCRNGHELTSDNVRVSTKPDGSRRRNCVQCARATARKYKREQRAAADAG